jgi:hypothetical protein
MCPEHERIRTALRKIRSVRSAESYVAARQADLRSYLDQLTQDELDEVIRSWAGDVIPADLDRL